MATENRAGILFEFIDRTRAGFSSIGGSLERLKGAAFGVRSALAGLGGALSVGAFAASIKNTIDQAEGFNKLAQRTGIATDTLSAFSFAAKLADVEQEALATGLRKLAANMAAAAGGSKEQAGIFKALGIELRGANGELKSTDTVLREVAGRFESFRDGPEKAALALALFGKTGDQLIPFLNGLRQSEEEARRFGATFGPEFAKASEEFNDNMKRLGLAAERFKVQVAGSIVPALADMTNAAVDANRRGTPAITALIDAMIVAGRKDILREDFGEQLRDINIELERAGRLSRAFPGGVVGTLIGVRESRLIDRKGILEALQAHEALRGRVGAEFEDVRDILARGPRSLTTAPVVNQNEKTTGKSPFQQALEQLQSERDKVEELTRSQEVLAAIERDRYGKLTTGQKQVLVGLAEEIDAIKNKTIAEKNYIEALQREQEVLDEARRLGGQSVLDRQKQLDSITGGTKISRIEELRRQQALVEDEILADRDPTGRFSERLAQIQDEIAALGERAKETAAIYQDFGLTLSSAFSAAVIEGKNLRDTVVGLGKDLLQLFAREYALKPIAKGAATIFEAILGAIAPKAAGGPVSGGRPYLVGEAGPELFVPGTSGSIVPNGGLGGRSIVQNIHLTVNSSGDARADGQAILATIVPVIKAVTRDTLVQESRVGGLLSPT